jgi:uncharacterized protein (TIGR00645 family)
MRPLPLARPNPSESAMTLPPGEPLRSPYLVRALERVIFASRWILAPFYLGLSLGLLLMLVEFVRGIVHLYVGIVEGGHDLVVIGILSLIDLSLVANLVIMVMFAGYENFISRLDTANSHDRPDWMGETSYGDLKLKLMGSIVAISAIQLLEGFMNIEHMTDRDLAWTAGIHMIFIFSAVLLALMDRISHK